MYFLLEVLLWCSCFLQLFDDLPTQINHCSGYIFCLPVHWCMFAGSQESYTRLSDSKQRSQLCTDGQGEGFVM